MANVELIAYETIGNQNKYKINETQGNLMDIFYISLDNAAVYKVDIVLNNIPTVFTIKEKNVSTDTVWLNKDSYSSNKFDIYKVEISNFGFQFTKLPSNNYEINIITYKL